MAKPIKLTPVLKGKDAVNFYNKLRLNKKEGLKKQRRKSIKEQADKLRAIMEA
ncbi:MAG: hypothetical protein WD267_04040 [Balneolales bacterium]